MPDSAGFSDLRHLSLAEVLSAFSHALDITEGQPEGHCVRVCWIGTHIGREIGLTDRQLWELYYTLILKDLGCSSNAARICQLYLTDDLSFKHDYKTIDTGVASALKFVFSHTGLKSGLSDRFRALANIITNGGEIAREMIETRCQRGAEISTMLRFSDDVAAGIRNLDEHWDGGGQPLGLTGTDIPVYSRIALLAQVIDVFHTAAGRTAAENEAAKRAGSWFDPDLVRAFMSVTANEAFWSTLASPNLREKIFELEPAQHTVPVDDDYLDDIAAAFGQVVDAKSPYTSGHSARVAEYVDHIATQLEVSPDRRRWLRRGAFLHDVGKLGVSNAILDKPGKLDDEEWVSMRAHAMNTQNILSRISAMSDLAPIAASHHERLDGNGYPSGLRADAIPIETRIITISDFYDALTADRPYRDAMSVEKALGIIGEEVGAAVDPDCYEALSEFCRSHAPTDPTED